MPAGAASSISTGSRPWALSSPCGAACLSTYETGDRADHPQRSAARATELLQQIGGYAPDEVTTMPRMISAHGAKAQVDDPLCELLKDADVLQHHVHNPGLGAARGFGARLTAMATELGLCVT